MIQNKKFLFYFKNASAAAASSSSLIVSWRLEDAKVVVCLTCACILFKLSGVGIFIESADFLIDKLKEREVFKGLCVSIGAIGFRLGGRFEAICVGLNVVLVGGAEEGW